MAPQIENIYPLSPMQQAMLFHTLYAPESEVYFEQMTCELGGALDLEAFEAAWRQVLTRHGVLRTAFDWQNMDEPVQVVLSEVELPFEVTDWRSLAPEEQAQRLESFLVEDREQGFDLASAPLLRIALFRLAEDRHRLVWSHHHLLLDGWSMPVLFEEFFVFYQALRQGETAPQLPVPQPYSDYIAWLQAQDLSAAEQLWRRELSGFNAATSIGLRRSRAAEAVPGQIFSQRRAHLGAEAMSRLGDIARQHRFTPNALLQGLWALWLSRHSGEDDVLFGVVVSGRPPQLAGVEGMVGLFLNTLPVRVSVDREAPFAAWVGLLGEKLSTLQEFEHCPLTEIQGWSEVPRGQPLFESLFVYENYPSVAPDGDDEANAAEGALTLDDYRVHEQTDLPLTLVIQPGDELHLEIKFDQRQYAAEAVDEILAQLVTLLEQVAADPDISLDRLSLLTEGGQSRLADPAAELPAPAPPSLIESFLAAAEADPSAPAVERGERSWSYGELQARAADTAKALAAAGLAAGEPVALEGERSFGLISSALGILWAGGALVAVDPNLPAERRRSMLEQAKVARLLSVAPVAAAPTDDGIEVRTVDPETGELEGGGTEGEAPTPVNDGPAYIFFTSGTTDRPKGVLGSHRGLGHFLAWQRTTFNAGPGDRLAQLTGWSFDVVLRDVFMPLTSGATLVLPEPGLEVYSHRLPAWLAERQISGMHTVPSIARSWLSAIGEAQPLQSLRHVFFAGEALGEDLVNAWRTVFGDGAELINLYGPTETTLAKCWFRVDEPPEPGVQPLGAAMPDTQALVLSSDGSRCGLGEPGEIVLRTPMRSLGFLDAEGADAARFFTNPWRSDDTDDQLYRTGDLGRFRLDGVLEILGRADDQIKIRGVRVEPAEVAAVLRAHEEVRDVAVVGLQDGGEARLAAYVVPEPARAPFANGKPRHVLPNNLAVAHLNKNETDYLYREIFELQAYVRHGMTFEDGAVIFDVGANIGLFQLFASLMCDRPRIYSFEPNPTLFKLLSTNAALYQTEAQLLPFAVGSKPGTAEFTFFPGFSMLSGFHTDAEVEKETIKSYMANQSQAGEEGMAPLLEQADEILADRFRTEKFPVEVRTLSQMIAELNVERIDLLKINVEKSELDVLRSISGDDWAKITQVVLEVDLEENLEPIVELLQSNGFETVVMQDQLLKATELCYVYAASDGRDLIRDQVEGDHLQYLPALPDPFISSEDLAFHARDALTEAMVPSSFVFLESLPLTANGKLDQAALPAPVTDRPESGEPYLAPRDAVELRLTQLWEDLLGVQPVGVRDDFFDLGGHSLLVAPLIGRIERELGAELSLTSLFEAPTVESLALLMRQGSTTVEPSCVVPIQPRGEATPVFCAHPLGGSPLCYQPLAQHLGPEQPLYGFDALHLVGSDRSYESLGEMAADYLEGMRRVQPEGPYRLAGWSFGGLVALEMATLLREAGEEVEMLAIFDTQMASFDVELPPVDDATVIEELLGPDLDLSADELRRLDPEDQLRHVVEFGQKAGTVPPDYELSTAREVLRIVRMNGELIQQYRPRPYPGTVTFFQAQGEGALAAGEKSLGRWRDLVGELEVVPVTGPHRYLVYEPHVESLAVKLKTCLEELRAVLQPA